MSSGRSTTARMAAICASESSVGTLIVLAPRPSSTRAAIGFAAGSITEIFACMSAGSSPPSFIAVNAQSTPTSAIRTLRNPCSAARRASSRQATTCSCPCAAGATTPPPEARAAAEVPQAAFGRVNSETSTRAAAARVPSRRAPRPCGGTPRFPARRGGRGRPGAPPPRGPRRGNAAPRCSGSRCDTALRPKNASPSPAGRRDRREEGRWRAGSREFPASEARILEQPREEARPHRQRVEADLLVLGVRATALDAEPVQHGDAERADQDGVGAPAGRGLLQVEAEPEADLSGAFEQSRALGRPLEGRPGPDAVDIDRRALGHGLEAAQRALEPLEIGLLRDANVESRVGER